MIVRFHHLRIMRAIRFISLSIIVFLILLLSINRHSNKEYVLLTDGCSIPYPYGNDELFIEFNDNRELKECTTEVAMLYSNDTHICIDYELIRDYLSATINPTCCYQPFYRPNSVSLSAKDAGRRLKYGPCIYFKDCIQVEHEFVMTNCEYLSEWNKTISWKKPFLFVIKKPLESARKPLQGGPNRNVNKPTYNVIVLGIDSMSRFNFYRYMTGTVDYLLSRDAIELMGYNKVGDSSFSSLMPLLTGRSAAEIKTTCALHSKAYLDNCPFLWHHFKRSGYYTAFAEECSHLFQQTSGFLLTPTDYYLDTYFDTLQKWNTETFFQTKTCVPCIGNRYSYRIFLYYMWNLLSILSNDRLFGFFWLKSMSHESHSLPRYLDDNFQVFVKSLDSFGYLKDTILIVTSDRGLRKGDFGQSFIGKSEERLPITMIVLPKTFHQFYPVAYENLKENHNRLTTPFDMYETLSDLANVSLITDEAIKRRTSEEYVRHRGISMFLPVPRSRTCEAAGLNVKDCSCLRGLSVDMTRVSETSAVLEAATFCVGVINFQVREYGICSILELSNILEATEFYVNGAKEYEIFFVVQQGEAEFFARVRYESKWKLVGDIEGIGIPMGRNCLGPIDKAYYCYCQ